MEVKLLVVHGRPQRKSLVFPRGSYVFGRGAECHIRPNSEWVSRQHCQLLVTSETASIRDLGSRNGTLINGERVMGARDLADGDQIQIGPLVFEVKLEHQAVPRSAPAMPPVPDDPDASPVDETQGYCLDTAPLPPRSAHAMVSEGAPAAPTKDELGSLPPTA
jgi:pSer/pThr/pTyr-binding forkhead associated (FHA) protein